MEKSVRQAPGRSDFTDRLSALRKERKVSQAVVADEIGVARSYLAGIEAGHDEPGRKVLKLLSEYYDVSLDWLASGTGPMRAGAAAALNEQEAMLLGAYREMPRQQADLLLQMALSCAKPQSN